MDKIMNELMNYDVCLWEYELFDRLNEKVYVMELLDMPSEYASTMVFKYSYHALNWLCENYLKEEIEFVKMCDEYFLEIGYITDRSKHLYGKGL